LKRKAQTAVRNASSSQVSGRIIHTISTFLAQLLPQGRSFESGAD
jgi:hypothetical protein